MEILAFIVIFTFIIGAVIGSFLNVVALRGLSGESIVLPPSKCPHCNNKLKPWHNIPILSYLFLRGKCAFCKEKISIQYPIVELLTALLLLGTLFKFGPTISAAFIFVAICVLLVMSVTDIKEKVICSTHAWFLIVMGFIYNGFLSWNTFHMSLVEKGYFLYNMHNFLSLSIVHSVIGCVVGVIIMEILAGSGYLFAGKRAFGTGDTYIAAGLGAFFGWQNLIMILPISVVIQMAFVLPGYLNKLITKGDKQTAASLLIFLLAAGIFSVCNFGYDLFDNIFVLCAASVILAGLGVWACICVIRGMRKDNDLTFLPFGPAMAIATLVVLFGLSNF